MCYGGGGGDDYLREQYEKQAAEEAARQARITEGKEAINSAFAGYDDTFYNERAQDYVDYATPQIEDQYKDAMKSLRIALARNNNLNSSYAAEKFADVKSDYLQGLTDAERKGMDYANQVRSSLASAQSNLQQQNASLADPTLIAQMAANSIASSTALPSYSPVAQLFAGVTDGLATQAQLEARNKNRYDMAELFNVGNRSRVVS